MGESGWLARNCTPMEAQRTHDCVFKINSFQDKTRVQTKYLFAGVRAVVADSVGVLGGMRGWSVGGWLVGWIGAGRFVRG